jgi:protein involved in polysaccharide export with SLBB domain
MLSSLVVEPGDVLRIQPVNLDSTIRLPGDQTVLPDGTISLLRYGRPIVAGKTVEEIEAIVREAIAARIDPKADKPEPISVQLVTRVSKVFYVQGEVNAPGSFQYSGRETVLDGLIAAGGLTDRASRTNIILSRPTPPCSDRIVLPICYRDIVQLGDTTTNYQLLPGDRIYVATRGLCEGGLFNRNDKCDYCSRPQVPGTLPPLPECAHKD